MKKLRLMMIASLGLSACSSAPTAEPAPPDVIVQWRTKASFFELQPVHFVEASRAPEVTLNVDTPWSRGRSSLLSPRATCPSTVIRVRSDGEVERGLELPMSQREVPTLNARCFPIGASERSLPDRRQEGGLPR
jgi:hypothetical protein